MQDNYKVTVGITPKPEILNPQCSCTECDSVSCFARRRTVQPCACEACTHTKSCLFYNTNINLAESKSGSINFKELERELARENITRELIKKEIIYELDNNNNKKITSKKQSKLSYKIVDSTDQFLMEERNVNPAGVHGVAVSNSRKEASPSTAKLTAQVMDVPYNDYQKSISKPNFPSNIATISPFDIFNKIKEAYKACSCKVCECIVGKSLQNDLCRCKPCDCNDCTNFNRHVQSFADSGIVPKDDDGCPCIRCDRGSCKGIGKGKTKNAHECDCVGVLKYEYLKGKGINSFIQACDCEPCQCMECKPKLIHRQGALIVAPVGEDYQQRNVCQCSPCECFECRHNYGLTSNRHHEMSTSVNRHPQCHCEMCVNEACIPDGNQSCRCETQSKVMRKPFQQDSHDYDIHRATVTYDAQRRRDNYDTIAMFASVPHSYLKHDEINKQCDCDQCECLVCKYKESKEQSYFSSKVFEPIENYRPRKEVTECKCSPFSCNFCSKIDSKPLNLKNVRGCDVCDCINCESLANFGVGVDKPMIKKPKSKFSAKGECKCDPCECADCEKIINTHIGDNCQCSNCENSIRETYSGEVIYPVKRGERLTPSLFRSKIKDAFIESCISNIEANEEILKKPIAFRSSLNKPSAFSTVLKTKTRNDYNIGASYQKCSPEKYSNHQIFPQNYSKRTETVKHAQISKCVSGSYCKNNEPNFKSTLSVNSSLSFINESGSITPTRSRLKSWENSCNSSGHDHPSYLIHFPKTTVEACLNDVMQFDTDKNINLTTTALSSKNNVRNQYNTDLITNVQKTVKYQPMRTVFSEDKPKYNFFDETEKENLRYSAQNFEHNPYRPRNLEVVHKNLNKLIKIQTSSVTRDGLSKRYEKHSALASKKSNDENFIFDEDYERVQNTLQEARVFSQHLVQLFEKYEKANRDFESVSGMIKKHANNKEDLKHSFNMHEEPTKEQNFKSTSGSSTEELVEILKLKMNINVTENTQLYNKCVNSSEEGTYFPEDNVTFNESCDENNEGRDESGDDVIKMNNDILKTITEEKEPIVLAHKQPNKRKTIKKFHKRYNKMLRSIICSKRICSKKFPNTSPNTSYVENEATYTEIIDDPEVENNKRYKENKNILFERINNLAYDNTTGDFKAEVKLPKTDEQVNLLKREKKSTTELRVSVTEKYTKEGGHTLQKDVLMIKQPKLEHSRQIVNLRDNEPSILKKNFQLSTNFYTCNREIYLTTPLEKDVKTAAKTISRQPPDENATYLYKNKALVKLHSEVKKLLDMPLLKTFESNTSDQKGKQEVTYNNLSKASFSQTNQGSEDCHFIQKSAYLDAMSPGNSCEAMKVSFLKVRRVSDHSVLVRWNTPRVLKNVEGYELLVDGRAVQKILSPSRNMAVVTCLPHTAKVLLTVRTVVNPPCPGHYPATTVIYQSKIK